jgi:Zn-dependent alcohol dehydrogenase
VEVAAVGDPVLLSFDFCDECALCKTRHWSNCTNSLPLNFGPHRIFKLASTASADDKGAAPGVGGHFFGQSSFAHFSIVKQASVVNVKGLVQDKEELQLFAPLGCGIQTGSGTVLNVAKAEPTDAICIMGLGGVGLSAIMAAKNSNCRIIIGIDRVEQRLALAKDLGATHVLNSSALPPGRKSLTEAIRALSDGVGPTITIDTTGAPSLIIEGMHFTRNCGKYIQVGAAPLDLTLSSVNVFEFMNSGKQWIGAIEGSAYPREFIPEMIRWYRDGNFPFDRLMKKIPAHDFEQALQE